MAGDESEHRGVAAFFDVDGTLAASNLVDAYMNFKLHYRRSLRKALWMLGFIPKLPYYAVVDMISRRMFNQVFFKNYKGVCLEHLNSWVSSEGKRFWTKRLFPAALKEVREHQGLGHKVVLVTGGLASMVQPLKELLNADGCMAVEMIYNEGTLTGKLSGEPLTGPIKGSGVRRLVSEWRLDATRSYAYADSYADRAFLESVGHPVAVNPDRRLKRLAKECGWEIKFWKKSHLAEQS